MLARSGTIPARGDLPGAPNADDKCGGADVAAAVSGYACHPGAADLEAAARRWSA
jgi:hypothetical protein